MPNIIKFDEAYISALKKKIINYVSHNGISINVINFNLTLFNKYTINDSENTEVHLTLPNITNGKLVGAVIDIDGGFFFVDNNEYHINPELEDLFCNKLVYVLIEGSSIKFKTENSKPISIESYGISEISKNNFGFHEALTTIISEEINGYVLPDFDDLYAFNKQIVRMIIAIIGKKHILSTYFGLDNTLTMYIYSLSSDNNLFDTINRELTLIKYLINTSKSEEAVINDNQRMIIEKLLKAKKVHLINMIIDELYIPCINNMGLDDRKVIRDNILKGFLGFNYTNLKLNEQNKESYYWASLINNTVPINNIVGDKAREYLREQIIRDDNANMHEVYVLDVAYKSKNIIKEFFVAKENDKVIIKSNKKNIMEKALVEEILSYAYINSIDEEARKKLEQGILLLCSKGGKFKCSLKGNPLNNKCLTACIVLLARKSGYFIEPIETTDNVAEFVVKKKEKDFE